MNRHHAQPRTPRTKHRLRLLATAAAVLPVVAVATAAGSSSLGKPLRAPAGLPRELTATLSGSGQVEASLKLDLSFSDQGRVAAVFVSVGDHVRRDQPLAQVDAA